ncbi:MAG TPA: hypothetical protein VFS36_09820 [Chitinophagaceae bacterium]|nr:hypothetical protein [Chitinophagaceae bacterium]
MKLRILASILFLSTQQVFAQNCNKGDDLSQTPGKFVDAAHCEWPQQKAHWFDQLQTAANKALATRMLTQIETLEKESRKNFILKGGVLKTSFGTPSNAKIPYGDKSLFSYDLNLGYHEYFCINNKVKINGEYSIVFRAYVNRFTGIESAFRFSEDYPYYETYNKYNGRFIALCNFIKEDDIKTINNGKGYYQDIPESSVKPGDRNTFITRHWYFTKPGVLLFVPVTRKEYLAALLEYYDREAMYTANKIKEIETECAGMMKDPAKYPQLYENGKRNLIVKKAKYPDWQKKIELKKAIVQKALKENTAEWLSKPAIVKAKTQTFSWKNYYGNGANDFANVEVNFADTPEDAQKTGSFTFSGFWDNKGGVTLYKYNPEYFKGAETNPVKPRFIELAYRYINTPAGKSLVENFTNNFNFDGVRNMLE